MPRGGNTRKLITGVNDLASQFPEVASQAYGWDPNSVLSGSKQKMSWRCPKGHVYEANIKNRRNGSGCPFCAGTAVLSGFNDLASVCPHIAKEAYEWNPATVTRGSNKKVKWRCDLGHIYEASPASRTAKDCNGTGCPYCANKIVLAGFNDLASLSPQLASEADGWDPSTVTASSGLKQRWKCKRDHTWLSAPNERQKGYDCPYCSSLLPWQGETDLKTVNPILSREAYNWDPSLYLPSSNKKKEWLCGKGHKYLARIADRHAGTGCPYCSFQQVLPGFNDLKTTHPQLALEAYGWDPSTVLYGSNIRKRWKCKKGHVWTTPVTNRQKNGCPTCAEGGFDPSMPAWLYLMERPGEQQIGISNKILDRLRRHELNGWTRIEVTGPHEGEAVYAAEKTIKKWLKLNIGTVKGTTENWETQHMEVCSLAELKLKVGLETDLF